MSNPDIASSNTELPDNPAALALQENKAGKSEKKGKVDSNHEVRPFNQQRLAPDTAQVRRLSLDVPEGTKPEDLENPKFWAHVAGQLSLYAEIRCMWEDGSRRAEVICTFCDGHNSTFKIIQMDELEKLKPRGLEVHPDYDIKQRGPKKWCIQNKKTGEFIRTMIPTQAKALSELDEYLTTLNR